MGNFDNYYIDGNGNKHKDIPLGTSPADAYVRTNMKLKKEVQRIDNSIQETNEHIDAEISRLDEAIVNTTDSTSRQLENVVNDINNNISEVSESIDTRISSEISTVNSRVDTIIAHNNDTEGNSELIDIREGTDGRAYSSAGTAVRSQIDAINSKLNGCGRFRQSFYGLNYPSNLVCVNNTTFYGLGNAFSIDFDFLGKVRAFTAVNTDLICDVMDEELNLIATATAQNKGQGLYFYDFEFNCDVSKYSVIVIGIRSTEKGIFRLGSAINTQFIPASYAQGVYRNANGWQALSSVSQTVPMELYSSEFVLDSVKRKELIGYNANNYIGSLQTVSGNFGYASYLDTAKKLSVVSEISLYCDKASSIHFVIGKTDQYGLLIPSSEFELSTERGYHTYDVKTRKLVVVPGEHLFVQTDALQIRTKSTSGYEQLVQKPIIIQDGTESQTPGYEGLILVKHDDFAVIFSYEIEEYDDTSDKINSIENKINNMSANKQQYPVLAKPNGDKDRLLLNSSGELVLNKYYPQKLFVMGNSLTDTTYHSQDDHYYQIGLAASNNYKDFFSLLCSYFKEKDPLFTASRRNLASWETATTSDARLNIIENNLANLVKGDEDMIIIQLGDNVSTSAQLSTFSEDYKYLIRWFREHCPKALVVCAGMWYFTEEKLNIVKSAADDMGVIFADFSRFAKETEYCSAIGNIQTIYDESNNVVGIREISNSGYASHPGDEGMNKIAQTIIDAIYP